MFPGRKIFRVLESDHFDGRVSAEFRVKTEEFAREVARLEKAVSDEESKVKVLQVKLDECRRLHTRTMYVFCCSHYLNPCAIRDVAACKS